MGSRNDLQSIRGGHAAIPPRSTRRFPAAWRISLLRIGAALLLGGVLGLLPGLSGPGSPAAELPDVNTLMRRVDELWRGKSSRARFTMKVKTRRYERSMTMEMWSEGKEKSLVKILQPKKDRGIATLKVESNIWNYLPKINRVTKIPPGMMMGSWMGSHFTNDDLVKESSFEDDYDSSITFAGERDGHRIYEVTSLPGPEAVVVWGKVVTVIEQETLLPLRAVYYDEEGLKARVMSFGEPRTFEGRTLPTRLTLIPVDKPRERTVVIYERIAFDVPLPEGLFSLRSLRKR